MKPWLLGVAIGLGFAASVVGVVRWQLQLKRLTDAPEPEPARVTVLGVEHHPGCLVARYRHCVEAPDGTMLSGDPDGFPWCTCDWRQMSAKRV